MQSEVVDTPEGDHDCQIPNDQAGRKLWKLHEEKGLINANYIPNSFEDGKARKKEFLIYAQEGQSAVRRYMHRCTSS